MITEHLYERKDNEIVNNKLQANIMIVDDHPLMRQALMELIIKHSEFKIVAQASNGVEAVELAIELQPDVIIMDIAMPKMNGLEATRQIKEKLPSVSILILTIYDDPEDIRGILEAGAAGYLMKDVLGNAVISALRSIITGERVLSEAVLNRILRYKPIPTKGQCSTFHERITQREFEILKLLVKGINNKDIAQVLGVETNTIRSHLATIFSKLGVSSRTEAVTVGLRIGLLDYEDIRL